jgi:hypothetical protein
MFPLRHKSLVSMRKMQAIQPQVKAIQDRYADLKATDPDRQKMNTEVMNLYREKGVNPATGCVPMLLTMPVLFAFYSMLSQAIRTARRRLRVLDPRSVDEGSVLRDSAAHGRDDVPAAVDDADERRPDAAADDDVHAAGADRRLSAAAERPGDLLSRQQPLSDWSAVCDQPDNRRPPASVPLRSAGEKRLKNAGGGKSPGAAGIKQGERRA